MKGGSFVFGKYLKKVLENKQLEQIAREQFKNTILNWREQNPEETYGMGNDEFNEEDLVLSTLNIINTGQNNYKYKIEATYCKFFSNNIKMVYILKFWDDFTIYDDVFYTERD